MSYDPILEKPYYWDEDQDKTSTRTSDWNHATKAGVITKGKNARLYKPPTKYLAKQNNPLIRENYRELDIVNKHEMAKILNVSVVTIGRMCSVGDIPFIRINSRGDKRFEPDKVIKALEKKYN